MTYTPTTWTNGVTACSMANFNNIENGIVQCVYRDGTNSFTGTQVFSQALSGSDKTFWRMTATDGKVYAFRQRASDNALWIRNETDSTDLLIIKPTGAAAMTSNINMNGVPNYIGVIGSRPAAGNAGRLAFITP